MESGLKQRIIGALVLVVAAVIFLPMLLSGQDETVEVQVDVPPAPVMDDRDIAPAVPPTLPDPAPVAEIPGAPVEPTAPEMEQEIALIEPPPAVVTPDPVEAPSEPAPPATATEGGWVVQQASFSSQSNAEAFRQTLAGQGYNAYVRAAEVGGKQMHRVYVGPLSSNEAATRVRDELQRHHDNKGSVVAYNEATRAP